MGNGKDGAALLEEYLQSRRISREAFGRLVLSSGAAVSRWVWRKRIPGIATAMRIEEATGRHVPVESWARVERKRKAA